MRAFKEARLVVTIAWRNVLKNRRRTILTMLTVIAGSTMVLFYRGMQNGTYSQMIDDAISPNTAHIQIHNKGFWEYQSIDYAFRPETELAARLDELEKAGGVAGRTRRIQAGALLAIGSTSSGALVQGIEPSKEKMVSSMEKKILPGGRFFTDADTTSIIIGETLAKNMGVHIGDAVSLISQDFTGSIAAGKFRVIGFFRTLNPEYDSSLSLIPFKQAAETFDMGSDDAADCFINSIAVRLSDIDAMPSTMAQLRAASDPGSIEVMGWDEMMPEILQLISMDKASAWIFICILYMIVAFGILNTIQMSVFERTRELGIMLAVGTRPGQIVMMVLCESMFISAIGIALGAVSGFALCRYYGVHPIDFSSYSNEMQVWGVSTMTMQTKLKWVNVLHTAEIIMALSLVFTLFPAVRASRLKPVEAIRHL